MGQARKEEKGGLFYLGPSLSRAAVTEHVWYAIRKLHQVESPNIVKSFLLETLG